MNSTLHGLQRLLPALLLALALPLAAQDTAAYATPAFAG